MDSKTGSTATTLIDKLTNSLPQVATIIVGVASFIGGVTVARINQTTTLSAEQVKSAGQQSLEGIKFQTGLILKAIDTADQKKAIKTLKFFAEAGLIPGYEKRILELATKEGGAAIPVFKFREIEEVYDETISRYSKAVGRISYPEGDCSAFVVPGGMVITAKFCSKGKSPESSLIMGRGSERDKKIYALKRKVELSENSELLAYYVDGDVEKTFGAIPLITRQPVAGERVAVMHYPARGQGSLLVSMDDCKVVDIDPSTKYSLKFECNTEAGSAGAPVIALSDYALLGVDSISIAGIQGASLMQKEVLSEKALREAAARMKTNPSR